MKKFDVYDGLRHANCDISGEISDTSVHFSAGGKQMVYRIANNIPLYNDVLKAQLHINFVTVVL